MFKRNGVFLAGLLIAALALVAAGCGGGGGGEAPEALPSSSCTAIEYEGEGNPDYLLVADFPLQGSSRTQTLQINDAIRAALKERDWKAGDYKIGFQSCDDATAQAGKWDSGKCSQNANAYAANDKVLAVIGTFNSGCAAIEIPVLNQAADGGIAMMSPANTFVCLTQGGPGCDASEPDKYYPSGTRNYARVAAPDSYQGAAVAEFAKEEGVKKVYILNDREAYGLGVATNFRGAAESVGIEIAGFEAWDPKAASYESLFKKIQGTGADGVFLGGLIDEHGAQVIKDKVAVLGDNEKVKLFAPDGFTTQQTIDEAKDAAAGMYLSVVGQPIDAFTGRAKEFAEQFAADYLNGKPIDPYAIYGGAAADVVLTAIEQSDGTRADVIAKMFAYKNDDSLLGPISFNEEGDIVGQGAYGITIYKATDKLVTEKVINPKQETVDAALGK